ncbi:unnamed protein product [Scytosiphon promiscuus]
MADMAPADRVLLGAVRKGDTAAVKKILSEAEGGAAAKGKVPSRRIGSAAVILAALRGHVGIVKILVERNVDLRAPASQLVRKFDKTLRTFPDGIQVATAAVIGGKLAALEIVLQAGADPNGVDVDHNNALIAACFDSNEARGMAMVHSLLKHGADPLLANTQGWVAFHAAARDGRIGLLSVLLQAAPTSLNLVDNSGLTPLGMATAFGRQEGVRCLLAFGASDRDLFQETCSSSLQIAVATGNMHVLRILLGQGLEAVGGLDAIPDALGCAVTKGKVDMLNEILSVEGEARRAFWARTRVSDDTTGRSMLHFAAGFGTLNCVKALLLSGASEAAADYNGQLPRDIIATIYPDDAPPAEKNPKNEASISRALQQGPAFRARSWAWPMGATAASSGCVSAMICSSRSTRPRLGVLVTRPASQWVYVTRFGRYAEK